MNPNSTSATHDADAASRREVLKLMGEFVPPTAQERKLLCGTLLFESYERRREAQRLSIHVPRIIQADAGCGKVVMRD